MRKITNLLPGLLVTGVVAHTFGQHSDVVLEVEQERIVTVDGATGLPAHVFESDLGELGVPGFTDDPGFSSDALAPGELVGFNVTDGLLFWDPNTLDFGPLPQEERLEISLFTASVTVTGDSGFVPGFDFAQASGSGGIHQHVNFTVKHPDFDPGDPFDNPISDGAYVLFLEITAGQHETSEPFAIAFNNGLSNDLFEQVLDDVRALFADCPGDLDGDDDVDLTDLSTLLTNFGTADGADPGDGDLDGDGDVDLTDLSTLLTNFGQTCA